MTIDNFIEALEKLEIKCTQKQLINLEKYYNLIIEYNKIMNLTRIISKEEMYLKNFYDSLTIIKEIDLNNVTKVCDIGSGAGFPGIVIKIFYPNLDVILIDSLNKRVKFLNLVINTLNLKNIVAIHSRIEEYAIKNREYFDLVTARAVAPLNVLLEYSIPLLKQNAYFIAMKGKDYEKDNCYNVLKKLNAKIIDVNKFKLPYENSDRTLYKIMKAGKTPLKYPRKYSEIKNKPL